MRRNNVLPVSVVWPEVYPCKIWCENVRLLMRYCAKRFVLSPTTGEIHPSVSTGDLGQVVELQSIRKLNDNEKYFLLKNHFVPTKGYKFPCHVHGNQTRQFQMKWLEKYNGLTYSESRDGGYCLFCVLFGRCEPSVKDLGILVSRPMTNFKKAVEKLNQHFVSSSRKSHLLAVEKAMAFLAVQEKKVSSVDQQLSSQRTEIKIKAVFIMTT